LIKYIKSVLWRVAKRLSYIEDAWCLKVNQKCILAFGVKGELGRKKKRATCIAQELSDIHKCA